MDDDDERVELSFGVLPERVFAGTPNATTVEIEDDDDPEVTVSFGESSYTVGEAARSRSGSSWTPIPNARW